MQVIMSLLLVSAALHLPGNYRLEVRLAKQSWLAWYSISLNVVAVHYLAQPLSSTLGKQTPLFRRRLPLTFHIISPGAYLRRRDGKLYNATGGSGFQSAAVRLSDWMQRITTCFSQHVAVKRRTGPQLSTF